MIGVNETNWDVDKNIRTKQLREFLSNEVKDNMIYKTFFNDVEILDIQSQEVLLSFKNYNKNSEQIYLNLYKESLDKSVEQVFGKFIKYKIVIEKDHKKTEQSLDQIIEQPKQTKNYFQNDYSDKSTFENYLKGGFNKEAVDIGTSISKLSVDFNIFFLSGPSGGGKTHLLQAIGKKIEESGKKSIYITPLIFNKKILTAIQDNKTNNITKLINYITNADIVLFDDFHIFGEGQKKQTKNFIYQIIEARMQKDVPTIISSEKELKELKLQFEDRLYTRLESGFISKISKPAENEIDNILNFLLEKNNIDPKIIDKESKLFVVKEFGGSIRSLLGAITKIKYYNDDLIKTDYVFSVIKKIFKERFKEIAELTPDVIIKKVSAYYKISVKEIMGKTRKKEIVIARHIAIILMDDILNMSSTEIGRYLNKDHTTILNALKKKKNEEIYSSIKLVLNQIKSEIYTTK